MAPARISRLNVALLYSGRWMEREGRLLALHIVMWFVNERDE